MSKLDPLFDVATFIVHHPDLDSLLLPVLQSLRIVLRYFKEEAWLQVTGLLILIVLSVAWYANYRYKKKVSSNST